MSDKPILKFLETEAKHLQQAGLFRRELTLAAPQGPTVTIGEKELLNLASNDYLGLSSHPELKKAAKSAMDLWGLGTASPRIVTGTLPIHLELERATADFLGTEDALLFPSGYHANTGLFESLFGDRDYVFCDELVHPSLADGIRLCRARVYSYRNQDMGHLEDRLKRSRAARFRAIVTDGFFSVLGESSKLAELYALAERYEAVVFVDDGQGLGVLGATGRGAHEAAGLEEKIDAITGTFGNALGGSGGYIAGRKPIIAWLRQKARPYLSSNAPSPAEVGAALKALELVRTDSKPRDTLRENVATFRNALVQNGLKISEGEHPAISVLVGDAVTTQRMADLLFRKGIFAMGFCYPVVPEGAARIRAQITAKHSKKALENAAAAFAEAARQAAQAGK